MEKLKKLNQKIIQSISARAAALDIRNELRSLNLTDFEFTCFKENPLCLPLNKLSAAMLLLKMHDEIFDLCCFPIKSYFSERPKPQQNNIRRLPIRTPDSSAFLRKNYSIRTTESP